MKNPFVYHISYSKLIGLRLSAWSFLALIDVPECCEMEDIGHFWIPLSSGKYNWLKATLGFKIIPTRP